MAGITAYSGFTHVTEHRMQVREDGSFFVLSGFLLCELQFWLVSLELCNNSPEVLLLLSTESVDLFQDRYTFLLVFAFTSFGILRNNSICRKDMQCW